MNPIEFQTPDGAKVVVDFSKVVAVRRMNRIFDDPVRKIQGYTVLLTFQGGAEIEVAETYDVIAGKFGKPEKKSPLV